MKKDIFITGTDTGVGKTFIAAALIRAMIRQGIRVCPMKPAETGCKMKKGDLVPQDALALMKASGVHEPLDLVNPYRFGHPLAPSVAAEIEGVRISRGKLRSAYRKLSGAYDVILVEGAGGIMVPIYKKYLYLDLAKDLRLPVLIVSRPGLGTINHSLLTIKAARDAGLKVIGVIINYADLSAKCSSEKSNPGVIEKLGRVPLLGVVPHSLNPDQRRMKKIFDAIALNLSPRR